MSGAVRICAVCRRVLDLHTDMSGASYMHTIQDAAVADHPPEPIPMPDNYREGRCDFCNYDLPDFVLPVRDFSVPGSKVSMSLGDWATCAPCGKLIEGNRWNDLVARVAAAREGLELRTVGEGERTLIARLYRAVRRNISGNLRPISG